MAGKRTPEVEAEILSRLELGETLRGICRDEHLPSPAAVCLWVSQDVEFAERYARARSLGLDALAEEMIEIADTPRIGQKVKEYKRGRNIVREVTTGDTVERARLQVDARKWLLSKLRPEKYGDRLDATLSGPDGSAIKTEHTIRFIEPVARKLLGAKPEEGESEDSE